MADLDSQQPHKYHINAITKSLQDFRFPLDSIFIVVGFPTWTEPRQSLTEQLSFRFPKVDVKRFSQQVIYAFASEPAEYGVPPARFRELLATKPLTCEVSIFRLI